MATRRHDAIEDERAALIDDACACNAPVELRYHTTENEILVAKSRILGADGERVYLDTPQPVGEEFEFRKGQKVEGDMLVNEVHYAFKSTVLGVRQTVKINKEGKVVGLVLRRLAIVTEGQRRMHFRVSVLGEKAITLNLHIAGSELIGACPLDAHMFEGTLGDLSEGGAAISVSFEDASAVAVGDLLHMSFRLPDEPTELFFLVEIRQMWAVAGETKRWIGLKVKPWPTLEAVSRRQQRLQRYITKVQLRRAG